MTKEEQRIAIAKACGWTAIQQGNTAHFQRMLGVSPANKGRTSDGGLILHEIPNYLNDLNAMRDAEKVLATEQHEQFRDLLFGLTMVYDHDCELNHRAYISATAAQRAEALLKTLNLWKE